MTVAVALLAVAPLPAQDAPPKSALTGATLLAGTRLDKGFFVRMAAKASMDLNAKDAGQTLTDEFEVYKLPASLGLAAVDATQAALTAQGWSVQFESTKSPDLEKWGWMTKPDPSTPRFLIYYQLDKKQSYLYLAKANSATVAESPVASPPPAAAPLPTTSSAVQSTSTAVVTPPAAPMTVPNGWTYKHTTFGDGWQSFDEADWVRGTKGSITARVHHATFDLVRFVNQDGTIFVWNQLIVPRYRDLSNVWVRKPWWEDNHQNFVSAEGTEIASGRRFYLVLFRNGNGSHWIEYLAPDKATFEREMGVTVQVQGGTHWEPLVRDGLNKFAVAASDLPGNWGSSSAAGVEYVSAITGQSLGIGAVSSNYKFTFRNDGTYEMRYVGASGMAGSQKFGGENWAGRIVMNGPWKMSLTGAFKGETYEHDVWFEAVKGGGRILVLRRNDYDIRLMRSGK